MRLKQYLVYLNQFRHRYINDSICGTWEALANAVYPGGLEQLSKLGWQIVGAEKFKWAEAIAPAMNVESNRSASFCYFRDQIRELADAAGQETL
jgi:hypothetical protein